LLFFDQIMRYQVDDRVLLKDNRSGIVKFIGTVKFSKGQWYGIVLDEAFTGKNDGEVKGKRYFKCSKNSGIFVKKEKISKVLPPRKLSSLRKSSLSKSPSSKSIHKTEPNFKVGGRVQCDKRVGTIKWIGMIGVVSYLGVELDKDFKGKNDGFAKGKRFFKCPAGQGIFWRPERVQNWWESEMVSQSSILKIKSDHPSQTKLKSSTSPGLVSTKSKSEIFESTSKTPKATSSNSLVPQDKPQLTELLDITRNTASNLLPNPVDLKKKTQITATKYNSSIPETFINSEKSQGARTSSFGAHKNSSFRNQRRHGRKTALTSSFIRSSFPKSSQHFRNYTEPSLEQIAKLVDHENRKSSGGSGSTVPIKHQRARSMMSFDRGAIVYDENILTSPLAREKIKQKNRRAKDIHRPDIGKKDDKLASVAADIKELWQMLEGAKVENINTEAKEAVENAKIMIENKLNELNIKLIDTQEKVRKQRLLITENREQFCLEKAELECSRERLAKEVQEKDRQLAALISQKELAQKEKLNMKAIIAKKNDDNVKLKQVQDELASVQRVLKFTLKEKEGLSKELEKFRDFNAERNMYLEERKSNRKERSQMMVECTEIHYRDSFNATISDKESWLSSPHLSSDSQGIFAECKNKRLSPHRETKSEYDDFISSEKQFNILSDSTLLSVDQLKLQNAKDIFNEISSIDDPIEPLPYFIPSDRNESNIFPLSQEDVESLALSQSNTAETWLNCGLESSTCEIRVSARGEDIDGDENRQSEGHSSVDTPQRKVSDETAGEDIEVKEHCYSTKFSCSTPVGSDSPNNLFSFSDAVEKDSSTSEKHCPKSTKRGKSYLAPPERKVSRTPKLREKSSRVRKASRSHFWTDSSDENITDFLSTAGIKKSMSLDIKACLQEEDISSSEDSYMYNTRIKSVRVFNAKNRQLSLRRMASDGQLYDNEQVKERFIDKKDQLRSHFHENSSSTLASFITNLTDYTTPGNNNLEQRMLCIRAWISSMKEEISTLETDPTTFSEIWAIIRPGRTKHIQQKLREIRIMIKDGEDLLRESISDKNLNAVTRAKECERQLENLGKNWKKKMEILPYQVKRNLTILIGEYWKIATCVREELQELKSDYSIKKHRRYKTIHIYLSSIRQAKRDNTTLIVLKESIKQLRERGEFLANIKSTETEDCLHDAMDLAVVHESVSKRIQKTSDAMKLEYHKQKQRDSNKRRKKASFQI